MRFRLTPRSVTLDDLELLLSLNFVGILRYFAFLGSNNG